MTCWLRALLALVLAALALPALAQAPSEPSFPKLTGRVVDDAHVVAGRGAAHARQLGGVLAGVEDRHRAALGQAIAILNCCSKADIDNVSFAALPEEKAGS